MKKNVLLLLVASAFCCCDYCLAQNVNLQWVKSIGTSTTDAVQGGMKTDVNNNLYISVFFESPADIDPGPNTVTVVGGSYLVKYDAAGNFIWYLESQLLTATDKNGNVYMLGAYDSTYDFDPGPGVRKITTPFTDICIAKYSTDRSLLWVDDLRGADVNSYAEISGGIVADNEGNCYIAGFIVGMIDLDPSANEASFQGNGSDNYFAAAYNANGDYKWAFKIDVENATYEFPRIAVGNNSVYMIGSVSGTSDLDPGPGTHNVKGNDYGGNGFIANYRRDNGSYSWGFGYASNDYYNQVKLLNADSSGNIVVSGFYAGPIDLDPGSGIAKVLGSGFFLAKYKNDGSYLWGKQASAPGYNSFHPFSMTIDPQNNILVAGADYKADSFNIAVIKYNSNGSETWDFKLNHFGGTDFVEGLITDGSGNFYVSGTFAGAVDFDPNSGVQNAISMGRQDAFFAEYKDNTSTLAVTLIDFAGEVNGKQNLLYWTTATEQNNTGFEVQRSSDGYNFNKIGFVNTKALDGNSNLKLRYTFSDIDFAAPANYYRLKQIDKDEKFTYSNIVLLRDENQLADGAINVYPNPAKNILNVKIASVNNKDVRLSVTDISGRTILNKSTLVSNGETLIQLDISHFSAGTYFIKLMSANGTEKTIKEFVKE